MLVKFLPQCDHSIPHLHRVPKKLTPFSLIVLFFTVCLSLILHDPIICQNWQLHMPPQICNRFSISGLLFSKRCFKIELYDQNIL